MLKLIVLSFPCFNIGYRYIKRNIGFFKSLLVKYISFHRHFVVSELFVHNISRFYPRIQAHNLETDSCAILISYSGENEDLLGINRILQARGIPTIAITSIGNNQLAKSCNTFLPLTTREKLYSKIGNFSSNTSIILLLNILYAVLFAQDYGGHYQHLKVTGRQIDFRKASHETLAEIRD